MNLPDKLLAALQSRLKMGFWTDQPRLVVLGANNDFVLITKRHIPIWNLECYKALNEMLNSASLQERGASDIHAINLHAYRFGSFVTISQNGTIQHENVPPHSIPGLHAMIKPVSLDTRAAQHRVLTRSTRSTSDMRDNLQRRPSNLQPRTQLRREWSESKQQFTAQARGMKLSISLSLSAGGLARLLG
jgi:hypothetical protein